MKKKIYHLCLLSSFLFLWGCKQPDPEQAGTPEALAEKAAAEDTSTASSAPVQEEPRDTSLMELEEITLRATGNSMEEIAFDPDTLEVKPGAHIKLTFINEGVDMPMVHNVVFTAPDKYKLVAIAGEKLGGSGDYVPDIPAVIASSPMVLPGQTVEMQFTAPIKPAAYNFVCTYPDHWHRMHGVLLVK